jgi:hypothetical protein
MSAGPTEMPEDGRSPSDGDASQFTAPESGLKPIQRLTSDDRLSRIRAETLAKTELKYCSQFVRDFVRSDYNFCAAKMTLARDGKLAALDAEFRVAEEWFRRATLWAKSRPGRTAYAPYEVITLEIKHALSGRLASLLIKHDRLFQYIMEGLANHTIAPHERKFALESARARIKQIPFLCIPDNDRFAPEGVLLPDIDSTN